MLSTDTLAPNGTTFTVSFTDPANGSAVSVALYQGGFVTHSLHMNARMAILDSAGFQSGVQAQQLNVTMPPSANVAIPGPYMVFVLVDGTPSVGTWVSLIPGGASRQPKMSSRAEFEQVTVVPPAAAVFSLSNNTSSANAVATNQQNSQAGRQALSGVFNAWWSGCLALLVWNIWLQQ